MRVALFATCLTDTLYPGTATAVVRLLERLGCAVEFPLGQTCCGQMHFNTGYRDEAKALARRHAAVLADKMRCVLNTGAEVLAAADNSCLMHIGGGLSRLKAGVRAMHLAEILASEGE